MSDVPRSDPTDLRRTRVPEPLSLASVPNPQEAKTGRARRAASTALATAGNTASRSARFPASESSSPGASAASARREAASDASTVTFVSTSATYSARPACTDSVAARSSAAENGGALEAARHARRSARRRATPPPPRASLYSPPPRRPRSRARAPLRWRPGLWRGWWRRARPRRSACGGGDARFPDRYASSKAARAASKRPDATAAALVSARRIAATQAPRVTDGEFERDAHKTPSNASERICVASPVSSPVRRVKEATQPETLLASPPRIHAHSSTARGDAFTRITAAATRTASRVTFATSRDCKACCFVTSRPHANSTNVQPSTAGAEPLSALPAKPSTARAKKTSGPTTAATSLNPSARSSLCAAHELWSLWSSVSTSSSLTKARSVSPSFAALAPSFGNQRGAAAAAAAATRRAHATSSSAGGPTRPRTPCGTRTPRPSPSTAAAPPPGTPPARPRPRRRTAHPGRNTEPRAAPASGGGFEPSAAARRSSLLSDRFFAFLSFENSLCGTYARPAAAFGPVPNASAARVRDAPRAGGRRDTRRWPEPRRRERRFADAVQRAERPAQSGASLSAPSFRERAPPRTAAVHRARQRGGRQRHGGVHHQAVRFVRGVVENAQNLNRSIQSRARTRARFDVFVETRPRGRGAERGGARVVVRIRAWWSVRRLERLRGERVQRGERQRGRRAAQPVDRRRSSPRVDGELLRRRLFREHFQNGNHARLARGDQQTLADGVEDDRAGKPRVDRRGDERVPRRQRAPRAARAKSATMRLRRPRGRIARGGPRRRSPRPTRPSYTRARRWRARPGSRPRGGEPPPGPPRSRRRPSPRSSTPARAARLAWRPSRSPRAPRATVASGSPSRRSCAAARAAPWRRTEPRGW